MQNIFLYQPDSGIHSINECRFSLLQILSLYNLKPPKDVSIVIYTDKPAMFETYAPFFENFRIIEKGFSNRFEIIKEKDVNSNVIFCSTESYLTSPIKPVFENISKGLIYVYSSKEISSDDFTNLQNIKSHLASNSIVINNQKIEYPQNIKFYNTQSIGLNSSHSELINNISELTKKLLIKFTFDLAESFAFAYYLSNKEVQFLKSSFKDFKNLPEFKQLLQMFFSKNEEESVPNLVKLIHNLNVETIIKDKENYTRLPFYKKWINTILGKEWSIKKYQNKI